MRWTGPPRASGSSRFRRSGPPARDNESILPDYAQVLSKLPIFAELTPAQMTFLTERVVAKHFGAGELIFAEGEPCTGMYVVESGHIRIFKSSSAGREQVLSIDGPGSSVAELPVFDGGPFPASGSAVDEVTVLLVRKQDYHALCLEHPEVALKVLRVVGSRLRRLVGIIEELSFTTVRRRLASYLCRLAQREGTRTTEGIEVLMPAGNQEVAAQIGTVRELVSRNLSRFQHEGLLKVDGRQLLIRDLAALEAELQGE